MLWFLLEAYSSGIIPYDFPLTQLFSRRASLLSSEHNKQVPPQGLCTYFSVFLGLSFHMCVYGSAPSLPSHISVQMSSLGWHLTTLYVKYLLRLRSRFFNNSYWMVTVFKMFTQKENSKALPHLSKGYSPVMKIKYECIKMQIPMQVLNKWHAPLLKLCITINTYWHWWNFITASMLFFILSNQMSAGQGNLWRQGRENNFKPWLRQCKL